MTIAHQIIHKHMAITNHLVRRTIYLFLLEATNASAKVTTAQWELVERVISIDMTNSEEVDHESILRLATFINSCG